MSIDYFEWLDREAELHRREEKREQDDRFRTLDDVELAAYRDYLDWRENQ